MRSGYTDLDGLLHLPLVEDAFVTIAFDPGGTTGWALFGVHKAAMRSDDYKILDNILFWSAGHFKGPEDDQVESMTRLAGAWPIASIVIEDFILRKFTMDRELLAPVRITAAFSHQLWLQDRGVRYAILQPPSLAMTTITDERQRSMDLWLPGMPHANDAIKHAVTWLRRKKTMLGKRT